jgi:hypothetical protein
MDINSNSIVLAVSGSFSFVGALFNAAYVMVRVVSSVPARLPAEVSVGRRFTVTLNVVVLDPVLSVALTSMLVEMTAFALVGFPTVTCNPVGPVNCNPEFGMIAVSEEEAVSVTAPVPPVTEMGTTSVVPTSIVRSEIADTVGAAIE